MNKIYLHVANQLPSLIYNFTVANILYNDFIVNIYIYNWIVNKFLQITSFSPYRYINDINNINQMTANVQVKSIMINKLSKIMSRRV